MKAHHRRDSISDDEIIRTFNEACLERRSPNVAVALTLDCTPVAAAQLIHRLRLQRPGDVLNGNVAKTAERHCPTCGSSPSGWRRSFDETTT